MNETSYHEAAHAVAAQSFGLGMTHVSVREAPGHSGGRCSIENGHLVSDHEAAIVMVAGEIAARMASGQERVYPNWLAATADMDSARYFVQRSSKDELEGRQLVQLKARSLLGRHWDAVEELAARLERNQTITGAEVEEVCRQFGVTKNAPTAPKRVKAGKVLDPSKHMISVQGVGNVTLRRWADALDRSAGNPQRAKALIRKGK